MSETEEAPSRPDRDEGLQAVENGGSDDTVKHDENSATTPATTGPVDDRQNGSSNGAVKNQNSRDDLQSTLAEKDDEPLKDTEVVEVESIPAAAKEDKVTELPTDDMQEEKIDDIQSKDQDEAEEPEVLDESQKHKRQMTLEESMKKNGSAKKLSIKLHVEKRPKHEEKPAEIDTETPTRKRRESRTVKEEEQHAEQPERKRKRKRVKNEPVVLPEDMVWDSDDDLTNEQPEVSKDSATHGAIAFIVAFRAHFEQFFDGVPDFGPQHLEQGVKNPDGLDETAEAIMCRLLSLALGRKKMIEVGRYARALEELRELINLYGTASDWVDIRVRDKDCVKSLDWKGRISFMKQCATWALLHNEQIRDAASEARENPNAPKYQRKRDRYNNNNNTLDKYMGKKSSKEEDEDEDLMIAAHGVDPIVAVGDLQYYLIQGNNDTAFRLYKSTNPLLRNVQWESVAGDREQLAAFTEKLKKNPKVDGDAIARLEQVIADLDSAQVRKEKREVRQDKLRRQQEEAEAALRGEGMYSGRTRGKRVNYNEADAAAKQEARRDVEEPRKKRRATTRKSMKEDDDDDGEENEEEEEDGDLEVDDDEVPEYGAGEEFDPDNDEDDPDEEDLGGAEVLPSRGGIRRSRRLRGGEEDDFFVEIGDNDRPVGLHGQSLIVTLRYRPPQPKFQPFTTNYGAFQNPNMGYKPFQRPPQYPPHMMMHQQQGGYPPQFQQHPQHQQLVYGAPGHHPQGPQGPFQHGGAPPPPGQQQYGFPPPPPDEMRRWIEQNQGQQFQPVPPPPQWFQQRHAGYQHQQHIPPQQQVPPGANQFAQHPQPQVHPQFQHQQQQQQQYPSPQHYSPQQQQHLPQQPQLPPHQQQYPPHQQQQYRPPQFQQSPQPQPPIQQQQHQQAYLQQPQPQPQPQPHQPHVG